MKQFALAISLALAAQTAAAQEMITYRTDQNFGDVTFGLENAIVGQGLVVDAVSHVGDTPGEVIIGFRDYPEGAMKEVQALLDSIARAAIGLD